MINKLFIIYYYMIYYQYDYYDFHYIINSSYLKD